MITQMEVLCREQVIRRGGFVVNAPIEEAFPLFTPEGELGWADGWDYQVIFPADGAAQHGLLFTTRDARGREMIWRMVRCEPPRHACYYVVTAGSHVQEVNVALQTGKNGTTDVRVEYVYTPFTGEGVAYVAAFTEDSYRLRMQQWERAIDHYLKTGQLLREE